MSSLSSAVPHIVQLPSSATRDLDGGPIDAFNITRAWVDKLNTLLDSREVLALSRLFREDCWWRDMLSLSWDLRTIHGLQRVTEYLREHISQSKLCNFRTRPSGAFPPALRNPSEGLEWIEAMFDFETAFGSGVGVCRLMLGSDGNWKAFAIYTSLQKLHGHGESLGKARPLGDRASMEENWLEKRQRQLEFVEADPAVLIIGAGQAGLNMAARLQQLGLTALVIDKNSRIGDNWRNRYKTLVTHDPIHYCHMAYMPFPKTWPMFTAKDKLGDWFEAYASVMELNVWTSTTVGKADYDEAKRAWLVQLNRAETSRRTIAPKHIVFCTGQAGEPKFEIFPGREDFGGTVFHGSQHQDASVNVDVRGKRVVVVGTGNSGHDIAQNYYENGADVTMVQRSGTYIITAKTGLFMLHEGMYEEDGPPTEDADIVGQSLPIPVQFALSVGLTKRISEAEQETRDGLTRAGFLIDDGYEGSGIYRKYITRGGGYYIDVGCSKLIIEGKIKVVLGDKVASKCKDVWGLDKEGEVNAIWKDSGHPGFWYMGGSLALCRIYSKFLALQIKAVEEGWVNSGK